MLCFTDGTLAEIESQAKTIAVDTRAADVLAEFRHKLRDRAETNVEADLLSELYNPGPSLDRRAPSGHSCTARPTAICGF